MITTTTIPSRHDVAAQLRRMPGLAPLPTLLGMLPPHRALQRVTFDSEKGVHPGVPMPAVIASLIGGWACCLAEGLGGPCSGTLEPSTATFPRTKTVPAIHIATLRARALATQRQISAAVVRHAVTEPAIRRLHGVSVHWHVLGEGAITADGCLLLEPNDGDSLRHGSAVRQLTALLMRWAGKTGSDLLPFLSGKGLSSLSVRWPLDVDLNSPPSDASHGSITPKSDGNSGNTRQAMN